MLKAGGLANYAFIGDKSLRIQGLTCLRMVTRPWKPGQTCEGLKAKASFEGAHDCS